MGEQQMKELKQGSRLGLLCIYIGLLYLVHWVAFESAGLPSGDKGIWLYSAFAALLLGNYLITPHFTKPVDTTAYSVAAMIAISTASIWDSGDKNGFDILVSIFALGYVVICLIISISAILLKDRLGNSGRIGEICFRLSGQFGTPNRIFSVVFVFALFIFHRSEPREYVTLSIFWIIVVVFQPLESIVSTSFWAKSLWKSKRELEHLGNVIAHEAPNIILFCNDAEKKVKFGDAIAVRNESGVPSVAIVLNQVGYVSSMWWRAIDIDNCHDEILEKQNKAIISGAVFAINYDNFSDSKFKEMKTISKNVLGLVSEGTTISRLNINFFRKDIDIKQGSLLETRIHDQNVLYQVIGATTRYEQLQQKNIYNYTQIQAQKIGIWNEGSSSFDKIAWLPEPNQIVHHYTATSIEPADALKHFVEINPIGHFPNTGFYVGLDINDLVTHNTAILGILGVGKTRLAVELIDRILMKDIKVLCLDVTGQYEKLLYHQKSNMYIIPDEMYGNFSELNNKILNFLDDTNTSKLLIINPDKIRSTNHIPELIWKMSELVLRKLQDMGETEEARCCLVYEEAHLLIPEWNATVNKEHQYSVNGTVKAIVQGRKFGLGCLVITQRTANVTKSILDQCNTVFSFRIYDDTGEKFLANYIGSEYVALLSSLEDRHAILFGKASKCSDPILLKLNETNDYLDSLK